MGVRSSGILLHPGSLPCDYGIGDLGPSAYRFADLLETAGQRLWQVLPLNPTEAAHGHSPYFSPSAFAGNPLLISPEVLMTQGLLAGSDIGPLPTQTRRRVAFRDVVPLKRRLLHRACGQFEAKGDTAAFKRFCDENVGWLDDFTLFTVLSERHHPRPWYEWPQPLRDRETGALAAARLTFGEAIRYQKILQFLFFQQWQALKRHCNQRRIRLVGDMPIYVPLESADVWANPGIFKLKADGTPAAVSGVPPDYFSETGQLWGHPVYDWRAIRKTDYGWWIDRMGHHFDLYDITRIDHFRGLVAYWEVPADAKTAINGAWAEAPVTDLFDRLIRRFGPLPVIAEDLGTITADVREVIARYGFPGMRVLLFAFGDDFPHGSFLPHNHVPNCVVYTGTHDNNTVRGWFQAEADRTIRRNLFRYLGREVPLDALHWEMIRLAMISTAETVLVPLQDVLGLGAEARMNRPARGGNNWRWRFAWEDFDPETTARLREMTETYGRG